MIYFDRATASDVFDGMRLLEGRLRGMGRALSPGALELRRIAEESLGVSRGQPPHNLDDPANDESVLALLTYDDVADRLQVSASTVKRLVKSKQLPTVCIGSSARVRPTDLEAYIDGLATKENA